MINEYRPPSLPAKAGKQPSSEWVEANGICAVKKLRAGSLLVSAKAEEQAAKVKGADYLFRALIAEMQEGCAAIAADGVILFCNKIFANIVRRPCEQVMGSSIYEYLKAGERESFAFFLSGRLGSFRTECRMKSGTGFSIPVLVSASSIMIEGEVFCSLVVTDLTEQRRSEMFAQMIFNQAREPIIECNAKGRICRANPAATALFGGQLVGKHFDEAISLRGVADGAKLGLCKIIEQCESAYRVEARCERRDGRQMTLAVSAGRVDIEGEGSAVGGVVMLTDITEKYVFEGELARLDRLNLVGEMAAGIGHEVRNPLTTVRGYLQMFCRREKYAEDHEQLKIMIEELDRANSIITDFLSLARDKSVDLQPGDLNRTVRALLPLLQAGALRLGHEIRADVGDISPVRYDDKEIRQLILNLVRNGLEAMEPGGVISIRTYCERGRVILSIADTGSGIPREILDRMGTPFLTTKEAGTGLGLSICYRIAERHEAEIAVRSSPAGTVFLIMFKVV